MLAQRNLERIGIANFNDSLRCGFLELKRTITLVSGKNSIFRKLPSQIFQFSSAFINSYPRNTRGSFYWSYIGLLSSFGSVLVTTLTHRTLEASVNTHRTWFGFMNLSFTDLFNTFCNCLYTSLCKVPQDNLRIDSFMILRFVHRPVFWRASSSKSVSCSGIAVKFGVPIGIHLQHYSNWANSSAVCRSFITCNAEKRSCSNWYQSLYTMLPDYLMLVLNKLHFRADRLRLRFCISP